MNPSPDSISWHVYSHSGIAHSTDWYWTLGLLALLGAGISIYFGNILFALILVVGAGTIGVLAAREPREHVVKVDRRGISVDGTLYYADTLHSFWVDRDSGTPHLFVTTTSIMTPHLSFPIHDDIDPERVRTVLRGLADEEEQGPSFGEQLAKAFGL